MWRFRIRSIPKRTLFWTGGVAALAGGCVSPDGGPPLAPTPVPGRFAYSYSRPSAPPGVPAAGPRAAGPVRPAAFQEPAQPGAPEQQPPPAATGPESLDDFVRLAITRNPRLSRLSLAIDQAGGRYLQAGLYPNPDLAVGWDDIGDRINAGGILNAPRVTQTIVTGRKLSLAQAVVAREIDQAKLALLAERYAVVGSVRAVFYEAYALQQRAEILEQLVRLAGEAVASGKTLFEAKQIARLDYVQLEVERERFRAELQAVRGELPGAYRRLAAVAGNNAVIPAQLAGSFEGLPDYDPEVARIAVLAFHPQVRSAKVGVDRAQAAVRSAQAAPIPNVTVYTGFIRQFENQSNDGQVGLSMPVPVFNRNQGNIRAAQAELGMAIQMVGQTENELAAQVAAAYQTYAAARQRAEVYRTEFIPRAEESYKLAMTAFKGGQFEYLRVIQAQRAVAEARLELNRSLGTAWRSAAELSGLLLEESWPFPPKGPGAGPVMVPPEPPPGANVPKP